MPDEKSPPPAPPSELEEPPYGHSSIVYTQILFWLGQYMMQYSGRTGVSTDQLIEEFGVNLRKVINPNWRPDA